MGQPADKPTPPAVIGIMLRPDGEVITTWTVESVETAEIMLDAAREVILAALSPVAETPTTA